MPLDFDSGLIDILDKCDLLPLREHFIGTTKAELLRLLNNRPIKHLKIKLRSILPQDALNPEEKIKKVIDALELENGDADEEDSDEPPLKIKKEMKIEKQEIKKEEDFQDYSENEVEILEDEDVSLEEEVRQKDKPIPYVEIQEGEKGDEEIEGERGQDSDSSTLTPSLDPVIISVDSQFQTSASTASTRRVTGDDSNRSILTSKEQRYIILNIIENVDNDVLYDGSDEDQDAEEQDNSLSNKKPRSQKKTKVDDKLGEFANWSWEDWMMDWSTTPIDFDFNLSDIYELHIFSECERPSNISRRLDLPNLKILEIKHDGFVNYGQELVNIIQGSGGNLKRIDFIYDADASLPTLLTILKGIDPPELLHKLKHLTIESGDAEVQPVALVSKQWELLSEINAPNLKEMYLGLSLWDDAKPGMEKMLRKFSALKELTIKGCFVTKSTRPPAIEIHFPAEMPNLEVLEIGGNYKYASIFETTADRPAKKKRKFHVAIESDTDDINGTRSDPEQELDSHGEVFSVKLNLPVLPKLRTLVLGCLYEIQDLHFSKMKQLEVFRVSSPWQDSVKFPRPERNKVYPTLKEMQFPDYLKNHKFVQHVVPYFPNVTKWYFNLPSVNVVRAFAHVMKNSNRRLQLLDLKVQFDFASSLDWIMLDQPWTVGEHPTEDERNNLETLKAYSHWEEYAQVNQIELPNYGDPELSLDEDEVKRFNGLEALAKRFSPLRKRDQTFLIKFLPRTLRLPKGVHHFNDDRCEFTDTLIGYRDMKYRFTPKAWSKSPKGIKVSGFDLSKVSHKRSTFYPDSGFVVDQSGASPATIKMEGQMIRQH